MDPERWSRLKAVFQDAFERGPSEQEALIEAACGQDAELREAVERMLRAHVRGAGLLDAPPPSFEAGGGETPLPARIGPYVIQRELGRGGMGTVYLAERDEPGLRKTVALKVVRHGMDSAFVVGRFRTERQILAALEHPGIARLYDGGTTDDGLPYFVMEYVDGEDVLSYCDTRQLPIPSRLRLFLRVCEAVQYAHQSLIVHRDLKPSNVLVTAAGEPKLLDFGIAKLLSPQVGEDGVDETASFVRMMTPDYASPEQMRGQRVTTASDAYSLGVILYELLSGHRPYRLRGASPSEVERAVFEGDLEPPSAAVTRTQKVAGGTGVTAVTPAEVSVRRQAAPRALRRRLRGDLDNVVLKALRRDAAERYATAADLAEDIRRHLDGFPVRARPDRRSYRAAKFLRRHRVGVTAGLAVVVSLVAGLGIAVRQARVAEAERRRAEARFEDVRRLANSVIYELHDAIANLPGATAARQVLVSRALEYLDRLAAEARDDVALQRELAGAYQRVAQVQGGGVGANLGDTKGAVESYGKALAIRQSLAARTPADPEDEFGLALLESELGSLERGLSRLDRAERALLSSAARLESLQRAGALSDERRGHLAAVYQRVAEVYAFQRKPEAALPWAEKAAAEAEAAWRARPQDPAALSRLAGTANELSSALAAHQRYPEALERSRQARALLEAGLRENPLDAHKTQLLLFVLHGEGSNLWKLGDLQGNLRVRAYALRVAKEALRRDPKDRWSKMGVVVAANKLGEALLDTRDARRSAAHFREALRIASQALAEDPQYGFARLEAGSAEFGLARALIAQGTSQGRAEGCAALRRVRDAWTALQATGQLPQGETSLLKTMAGRLAGCPPAR